MQYLTESSHSVLGIVNRPFPRMRGEAAPSACGGRRAPRRTSRPILGRRLHRHGEGGQGGGVPVCLSRELRHQAVALAGELIGDLGRLLCGHPCLALVGGVALRDVLGSHRLDARDPSRDGVDLGVDQDGAYRGSGRR
jgi:hypothetical protein